MYILYIISCIISYICICLRKRIVLRNEYIYILFIIFYIYIYVLVYMKG